MKTTSFFLLLCAIVCAETLFAQTTKAGDKPDLIVSYAKITSVDVSLGTFSCEYRIKNIGTKSVNLKESGVTFTGFTSENDTWDDNDTRVHGIMYVNDRLAPGQTSSVYRFESRTGVDGDGYLLLVIDPYKKVTELQERNNYLAKKKPLVVGQ